MEFATYRKVVSLLDARKADLEVEIFRMESSYTTRYRKSFYLCLNISSSATSLN